VNAPLVVRVPKLRGMIVMAANAVIAGWGAYLAVTRDSALDVILGLVLVVVTAPLAAVVAWFLVRNEPVLTVSDQGIEVPKLGLVTWLEIGALNLDDKKLDLNAARGDARIPVGRMDTSPKELRAQIAARSGGSWVSGQWTSRGS
jgi:hypothetical protein